MTPEPSQPPRSAAPEIVAAVSEVLVRYATGIDTRDWELFRTCFTEVCDVDYGRLPPDDKVQRWESAEAITGWMEAAHEPFGHTLHRITNQRVEDGAPGVTARSYVDVLILAKTGEAVVRGAGFYEDELVETEDGWKIAKRRFTNVHRQI